MSIKHLILVLEGGGAKGPIHVGELEYIEHILGKKLSNIFDLFVTTSIGTVEGSIYVSGKLSVSEFWDFLEPNMKTVFKSKHIFKFPRLDINSYATLYDKYVGKNILFGDAVKPFIFTSVDLVDGKTHFFKSTDEPDKHYLMKDICKRSFAAPVYFGSIIDDKTKSVWADGGTGMMNLPLIEAYAEALKRGWLNDGHKTHILALGTGRVKYELPFSKFKRSKFGNFFRELGSYMSPTNGGLARIQSTLYQVRMLKFFAQCNSNLSFQWIDTYLDKKLDAMANWKARWDYYNIGKDLSKKINIDNLRLDI